MEAEVSLTPNQVTAEAVPWTLRDTWLGVGCLALWWVALIALRLVTQYSSEDIDPGLVIGLGEAAFLLPVWWFTMRKYGSNWQALGLRGFQAGMVGLGCGLLLGSFAFNFLYSSVLALFGLRAQVNLVPILAQLSSPWLLLLAGVIIAPLVEELFFRGYVFAGLRPRYGWPKAAAISSALFALFHLQPLAILPIFLLGYFFAFLYQRSRSLWPSILMHMLMNALALGVALLAAKMGIMPGTDPADFWSPLAPTPSWHSPLPTLTP